jgi:carotenoid 1,2-hydratase
MTERSRGSVQVQRHLLSVGPSRLQWDGAAYEFELHERGCPLPQPLRGTVQVQPLLQPTLVYALDRAAHHFWAPLAPRCRVQVRLTAPRQHWSGEAYLDSNRGNRALERDFSGWQWSRAASAAGPAVFYDTLPRHEAPWPLAVQFGADQSTHSIALPPAVALPHSAWGIGRQVRSDAPQRTELLRTLVDAPFYARSLLRTQLGAESVLSVHESLDLQRFGRRWVRWLLPFRMPRRRR